MGAGADQVAFLEQSDAHRVDERVAGIARAEVHLAAQRWDADAVAVVPDAAHDAAEQIAVARVVEGPEAQTVQERDGPGTHGEHVAQDAAGAGGGPLVRLDGGGVVVRLDLEGDRPAVRKAQDTRVLPRALDHLRTGHRQRLEDGLAVLVGAVLAPQRGENAKLGERGRATQEGLDAAVLVGGEVVLANQRQGDRGVAREGRGGGAPGHVSDARAPLTPFNTARNTREKMPRSSWSSRDSASPASNQRPWQCVH